MEAFDTLVQWLSKRMDDLGVPGAAVRVSIGDQRFMRGIGVANVDSGAEFTPSTLFGITSLTKIFTATALASLAYGSAVDLSDPVRQYLPAFRLADPEATIAVTVGHLLSHAGGWADLNEPGLGQDSLDFYVGQMAHLPQVATAGNYFSYSNSGFVAAGAVVEHVTGMSYEEIISASIL